MEKLQIQAGMICLAKTRYCAVELLCTIVMYDNSTVKVKLPCTIRGATHDFVNIKDIVIQEKKKKEEAPAPVKDPKHNPFKKVLEQLKAEEDRPKTYTALAEQAQQIKALNKLSLEQQQYIAGLTAEDQQAYLRLWA